MKLKRFLLLLLATVLLLSLFSCKDNKAESSESEPAEREYILKVRTEGGMPIANHTLKVYTDSSATDLESAGSTDENGVFSFKALESDKYIAVLSSLPEGFVAEQQYVLKSGDNEIIVKTELMENNNTNYVLSLGKIAFDFEITDVNGSKYKASELLKTKKALVINFWFENCGPCKMEFPFMQESYDEYKDKLEILALNPCDGNQESVKKYAESLSLSFPMASVGEEWGTGIWGYPTTVVIDRYGMVVFSHTGAITDKATFDKLFEYFTADDYVQKSIRNISEIN